jgi:hypothetical protein
MISMTISEVEMMRTMQLRWYKKDILMYLTNMVLSIDSLNDILKNIPNDLDTLKGKVISQNPMDQK